MSYPRSNDRLYTRLTYAGALPFVACAVLPWAGWPVLPGGGSFASIAAGYSLAIVSFMAGVHWGTWLYNSDSLTDGSAGKPADGLPLNLLLTSNVITVSVWLTFVLSTLVVSLTVSAAAFLLLLIIDVRLAGAGLLSPEYLRTRRNVTLIVVAMLLLTAAALT
jgi:hypothetical protein